MDLEILYEDNHLIAVNKTGADLVQGDESGDEPLSDKVKAYIKENTTNLETCSWELLTGLTDL